MLRFDLKSILRRMRPRTTKVALPEIRPTGVLAADLERILQRVLRGWWTACRDVLMPAYRNALATAQARAAAPAVTMDDANTLGDTTASISDQMERLVLELVPDLRDWVLRVETWHRGKFAAGLTPSGVSVGTMLGPTDVQQTLEATVQANVSLVRSISSEARSRIEGIILRGFQQRLQADQIAREITSAVGLGRARARRIASDQTSKLSAQLDTERFRQVGIEEFTWVHSGKVHFRPWHKARNGKRFKLDGEIVPDDMPGIPPFCGCRKRAELTLR